ncbi:polysaccharide deacetylase family protein [Pseudoduganella sp. S-14]|uniref:polysaccharide deacetylase family protein n=1 Tax=Pseudoduganella sp. S-14 TaxID=3404065 RepID=UPI003CF7706A
MMRAALSATVLLWAAASAASACEPDALGVARVLTLKREHARYGTAQYGPLPLQKGEVVLTFDDGPVPGPTDRVLQALAAQCTQATFFMTGANLAKYPELGLRVMRAGHAVGLHSFAHPSLKSMPAPEQLADLEQGERAFVGVFGSAPPAYRFPFLEETAPVLAVLKERKVTVASVDLGIDDWAPNDMRVDTLVARLVGQLKQKEGGIILMHDANGPTADALPALLKAIRDNGYKVVSLRWEDGAGPITH